MSIDNIVGNIIQQAKEKAEGLKAEALKGRESILREAEKEAGALREGIIKTAQEKADKDGRHGLVNANLEARKDILAEKQLLIQECFAKVVKAIASFSPLESQRLIKLILARIQEKETKEIIFSEQDKEKLGLEWRRDLAWPSSLANIPSGFILKGERIYIDCTWEKIVEQIKPEFIYEISRILFFNHESS